MANQQTSHYSVNQTGPRDQFTDPGFIPYRAAKTLILNWLMVGFLAGTIAASLLFWYAEENSQSDTPLSPAGEVKGDEAPPQTAPVPRAAVAPSAAGDADPAGSK